jgi:hypothetical protein
VGSIDDQQNEKRRVTGRLTIRVPASLHRDLLESAEEEGVSLSQFVCAMLASGMRWRQSAVGDGDARSGASTRGASGLPPGGDRTSDEEFSRIWRELLA